jgi:8-oxo-dGTP pyrophosphatase MutT (NUDIX family)
MKFKKEVSAGGIVYKKEGDKVLWLITQHSQHKGWSFPKGLVGDEDKDEKMETAALREVREEGGIEAKIVNENPIEVKYKYQFKDYLIDKTVYYYLMEYLSGDPKDHDWEVAEAKFVEKEEAEKTLSFKTDKEAFAKAQSAFYV